MCIYIAASFPRREEAESLSLTLKGLGHRVVSKWHSVDKIYGSDDELPERALRDFDNLYVADTFISFIGDSMSHGGRHTEFGIALMSGMRILLIGNREQVLHWYPGIKVYKNVKELLLEL